MRAWLLVAVSWPLPCFYTGTALGGGAPNPSCSRLAGGSGEGGTRRSGFLILPQTASCPIPILLSRRFSQLWGAAQPTV